MVLVNDLYYAETQWTHNHDIMIDVAAVVSNESDSQVECHADSRKHVGFNGL